MWNQKNEARSSEIVFEIFPASFWNRFKASVEIALFGKTTFRGTLGLPHADKAIQLGSDIDAHEGNATSESDTGR